MPDYCDPDYAERLLQAAMTRWADRNEEDDSDGSGAIGVRVPIKPSPGTLQANSTREAESTKAEGG